METEDLTGYICDSVKHPLCSLYIW